MKKYTRKPKILIAILVAIIATDRLYYFQNGGFHPSKLISTIPPHLDPPPKEIDSLLDQPFHYFGKGGTSFVFLGEDGRTILKLFKHQHLSPKSMLFSTSLPGAADGLRIQKILSNKKKHAHKHQSFFLNSCKLAEGLLKEETALIYLCKEPNPHFAKPVKLIDTWGFAHSINLSQTEFAIQKKAELFFPYLENLLKTGQKEQIYYAIDALLEQIRYRCQKGIGDRDPNLLINFGFIDGKVVEFDLGSYFPSPELKNPLMEAKELFFATYALQKWLEKHCPEHLDYLLENIASHETLP